MNIWMIEVSTERKKKRGKETEKVSMKKICLKEYILSPGGLISCNLESWQSPGTFSFENVDSPGGPNGWNLGDWPSPEISIDSNWRTKLNNAPRRCTFNFHFHQIMNLLYGYENRINFPSYFWPVHIVVTTPAKRGNMCTYTWNI